MTFAVGDVVQFKDRGIVYSVRNVKANGFLRFVGYEDALGWFDPKDYSLYNPVQPGAKFDIDMVNQPPHYKFDNGVEVIDLTEQLNFNCGNAVKYLARAGRKTEDALEDLKKAEFYVKREIARVQQ